MAENPVDNIEQRVVEIKDFFGRFGLERAFADTASDLISRIELF